MVRSARADFINLLWSPSLIYFYFFACKQIYQIQKTVVGTKAHSLSQNFLVLIHPIIDLGEHQADTQTDSHTQHGNLG